MDNETLLFRYRSFIKKKENSMAKMKKIIRRLKAT